MSKWLCSMCVTKLNMTRETTKKYKALLSAKSCRMHLFHVPPVVRINEFSTSDISLNTLILFLRALSVHGLCSVLPTKLIKNCLMSKLTQDIIDG